MGQRELELNAKHREEERLFKIAQAQKLIRGQNCSLLGFYLWFLMQNSIE
jgi:hypothetical protein